MENLNEERLNIISKRNMIVDEITKISDYIINAERKDNRIASEKACDRRRELESELKSLDERLFKLNQEIVDH